MSAVRCMGLRKRIFRNFLLKCPGLQDIRISYWDLRKPHVEDKERIVENYLFEVRNIEKKKFQLYKM